MKTFIQHEMSCSAEVLNFLNDAEVCLLTSAFLNINGSEPHICERALLWYILQSVWFWKTLSGCWINLTEGYSNVSRHISLRFRHSALFSALNTKSKSTPHLPTTPLSVFPHGSHWTQEAWCLLLFFDLSGAGGGIKHTLISLPISLHWTKSKHAKSPVSCTHFLIMKESSRGHKGTCVTHRHIPVCVKLSRCTCHPFKSGQVNMLI